jgi:hypothetical protein
MSRNNVKAMRANASLFAAADIQCLQNRLFDDSAGSLWTFPERITPPGAECALVLTFSSEEDGSAKRQRSLIARFPSGDQALVLFSKLINPVKLGALIQLLIYSGSCHVAVEQSQLPLLPNYWPTERFVPLLFAFARRRALLIVVWQRGIEIGSSKEKANASLISTKVGGCFGTDFICTWNKLIELEIVSVSSVYDERAQSLPWKFSMCLVN